MEKFSNYKPAKKTAHWIHDKVKDSHYPSGYKSLPACTCSSCGYISNIEKEICPRCRAIMSEERE